MALSSLFKRNPSDDAAGLQADAPVKASRRKAAAATAEGPAAASDVPHESPAVVQARTHARRRLIGASVLLLLGVLLFPLVFETQPRPLPMDMSITVAPAKGALGAPAAQPAQPVQPAQPTQAPLPVATAARPSPPMITETAEPEPAPAAAPAVTAPTPMPPAASAPVAVAAAAAVVAPTAAKASAPAAARPAVPVSAATAPPASSPAVGRFVVQVGAFADEATVRQTRQKVEKLGLKTYTQEVNTEAGKRVRVRVGPFAEREEAAQVLQTLKGAGLPGAVLAL